MAKHALSSLKADQFDYWSAHHLLNRAGFGGTPEQVRAMAGLGLDGAVDYIIDYDRIPYESVALDAFDSDIMRPLTADERQQRRRARRQSDEAALETFRRQRQQRQRADRAQMAEIQRWWMKRLIETPRPLEEKMTLFWHGHFATGYRTIEDSYHMFLQNDLFRRHAVGNFRALTHGIIRDPAMLRYLNNNQNRRRQPNENLARELMELFTLGEGNGYTERDIKEGARALTGYTYDDDEAVFRERLHDDGSKRILGQTGRLDGTDFVNIIFRQRYVSEFMCRKLYRFFVNDLPAGPDKDAQRFIVKLAQRFRDSEYDVKSILRTMFRSAHFYDPKNIAAQIKSPIQLLVQTIRTLRTPTRSISTLLSAADLMGQNICFPPSVKGWEVGRTWINTSTLFVRQNIVLYLLTGQRPDGEPWDADGEPFDASHLIAHLSPGGEPVEPRAAVIYLLRFMLGTDPQPQRVEALLGYIDSSGGSVNADTVLGSMALIASMPEFQLC